jgi:hypothetical protein
MKIERNRVIMASGTLICALGIGYFMQSGASQPAATTSGQVVATSAMVAGTAFNAPVSDTEQPRVPRVELSKVMLTSAAPARPQMPELSRLPAPPLSEVALLEQADEQPPQAQAQPQPGCDYEMTAKTEAAAMVRLSLSAPCMRNERFTLHHNGMMLSETTDARGARNFVVPALAETSVFIAAFANGEGAVATAEVGALSLYDRAVVQWQGAGGLQLHALEFGAQYGGEGHVWAGVARDLTVAASGEGGFITRHGDNTLDDALVAEVYTFPTGATEREGPVALSVEAEITSANCGRDLEAQSIQKTANGSLRTHVLTLAMPDCKAVGDFLVLKNLLNDLKVASR